MYYLDFPEYNLLTESQEEKGSARSRKTSSTANQNIILSLHNRWGHIFIDKIRNSLRNKSIIGAGVNYEQIKNFQMPVCNTCLLGHMKTDPTPSSFTEKDDLKPLEIICTDIKGPFPKQSTFGNKWFILFICGIFYKK